MFLSAMKETYRCWAEIDRAALRHNAKVVRERIVFDGAPDAPSMVERMLGLAGEPGQHPDDLTVLVLYCRDDG